MAYKVIILYRLYMPSYFLGTFTEYPFLCSGQTGKRLLWLVCSSVYLNTKYLRAKKFHK